MTIIVTGGAGFIGSNFIFYMLDKHPEDRIVCVDKLTYAGNLSTLESVMDKPNFRFVKADICDRKAIYDLFEEEHPDVVVNFAAESHVDRSIENPEVFLQTNILGTQVMLDACRKYGIQRYHQVSTDEVYGDLPLDRPRAAHGAEAADGAGRIRVCHTGGFPGQYDLRQAGVLRRRDVHCRPGRPARPAEDAHQRPALRRRVRLLVHRQAHRHL